MTTQDFIALFQEAFGKKVQLPLLFGYSDKPIAITEKIGGCFTIPMSAMISCNDGFRPFSFYIEVIE